MYNKKRMSKDKTIIIMSVVSVMAISALAAGAMFWDNQSTQNKDTKIAKLDETENTADKDVNAKAEKETSANISETTTNTDNSDSTSWNDWESEELTTDDAAQSNVAGHEQDSSSAMQENITTDSGAEVALNGSMPLQFQKNSTLIWPVETNDIIIDFSIDQTTYFATLDMYKTSDAVCIRSDVNSPVYSSCTGIVKEIGYNEEIGHFVTMDLGNNYELTYGQLKDIQISDGNTIAEGDLLGYISEPTKYYTVEGSNLYLKLTENGTPIDPLDFLDFE